MELQSIALPTELREGAPTKTSIAERENGQKHVDELLKAIVEHTSTN